MVKFIMHMTPFTRFMFDPGTIVIPEHGRLRQENLEFEASLGYIAKLCFKIPPHHTKKKDSSLINLL
jgi:hypothetical protein